jgi:hypothetical protein
MTNRKHASEMNDTEFAQAVARREWRTAAGAGQGKIAAPAAPAKPVGNTSSTVKPPQQAPATVTKPALAMSETEFEAALKAKAWRSGQPTI